MENNLLWDLMEVEAEKYFINDATLPGIIIASGPFTAPDAKRYEFATVYFGRGIAHWNFKNKAQARLKVKEILTTANKRITVFVEDDKGKRIFGYFGKEEANTK